MMKNARNMSCAGTLLACALFLICSAGIAKAGYIDETLDYSGAAFTSCFGSYSTSPSTTTAESPGACITPTPFVSGWITIKGYIYDGWDSYEWPTTNFGGSYGSLSVSFSFTDNDLVTLSSSELYAGSCDGCLQLDYESGEGIGGIVAWSINLTCVSGDTGSNCGPGIGSAEIGLNGCTTESSCTNFTSGDYSEFYVSEGDPGGSNFVAGTLTLAGASAVPEPRYLGVLLLAGLALAGIKQTRRNST